MSDDIHNLIKNTSLESAIDTVDLEKYQMAVTTDFDSPMLAWVANYCQLRPVFGSTIIQSDGSEIRFDRPKACPDGSLDESDLEKFITQCEMREHQGEMLSPADYNNLGCAWAWRHDDVSQATRALNQGLSVAEEGSDAAETMRFNLNLLEQQPLPISAPSREVALIVERFNATKATEQPATRWMRTMSDAEIKRLR